MIRFLLRLIIVITVGCGCIIAAAVVVGRVLLEDEIAVSARLDNHNSEIYRVALNRGIIIPLTHNEDSDTHPTWSPDGTQLAFVNQDGGHPQIYLMDAQGHDMRRLTTSDEIELNPAWSPDGRYIAYEQTISSLASVLLMADLQTGTTTYLTDGDRRARTSTWSPDSRSVAVIGNLNNTGIENIYTVDIQNGTMRVLIESDSTIGLPAWSPDGRYLAYAGGSPPNTDVYLWEVARSETISLGITAAFIASAPTWSPDGQFLILTLPVDTTAGNIINTGIFKLNITACLQAKANCVPEFITLKPSFYTGADWRPH